MWGVPVVLSNGVTQVTDDFIARCMRARAHRKRNAIRQPMRVPPENVAVLAANFVAAIAVISLNKRAFVYFPFPAASRYFTTFSRGAGIEALRHAGKFEPRPVPPGNERTFYTLIVCWSACNALSNVSLDRNSVGFYQLAKLMITPLLVAFDFVCYGRRTTLGQAVALLLSCAGVGLASVNDVQLHGGRRGGCVRGGHHRRNAKGDQFTRATIWRHDVAASDAQCIPVNGAPLARIHSADGSPASSPRLAQAGHRARHAVDLCKRRRGLLRHVVGDSHLWNDKRPRARAPRPGEDVQRCRRRCRLL